MITPNEWCRKCRYASCSTTVWPCSVCKRIHNYDDYFVPAKEDEDLSFEATHKTKGEAE